MNTEEEATDRREEFYFFNCVFFRHEITFVIIFYLTKHKGTRVQAQRERASSQFLKATFG
jgi:hypothetical protein